MEQTDKPKSGKTKIATIGILASVAIFVAVALMSSQVPTIKVVDADEISSLKAQIELLNKTVNFHQSILQQHDTQIQQLGNNTVIIAKWAQDFSQKTNERLATLEGQK